MARKDKKPPRAPKIDTAEQSRRGTALGESDPSDAFAASDQPPEIEVDWTQVDPPEDDKPKRPKKPSREIAKVDEDDESPEDMADEIIGTLDGVFALAAGLRGYTLIQMPDGSMMLTHVMPTDKGKARLKRALIRLVKNAGASLSPPAACAWAAFSCYGAPVIALEMARYSGKKKAAAKAGA